MLNIFKICIDCVWKICSRRNGWENTRQSFSSPTTTKVNKKLVFDKEKFNRLLKGANKKELETARKVMDDNEKLIIDDKKKAELAKNEKILLRAKEVHALLHLFNPRFY